MFLEGLLGIAVDAAVASGQSSQVTPASSGAIATPVAQHCPDDMGWVHGTHYENVQRLCIDYREGHCFSFFPKLLLLEPRATAVDVCMDRYEWPNHRGVLPDVMMRFDEAESSCAVLGKRLCTEFEWELACEGPSTLPWPYGAALDPERCHTDQAYRPYSASKLSSANEQVRSSETVRLYQGARAGEHDGCRSAFGIFDLVGNVEEWTSTSRPEWPYRSSLKGGYWSKPWAGCRGTNERHGPGFRFYEIGFRCCRDPDPTETVTPAPPTATGSAGQSVG